MKTFYITKDNMDVHWVWDVEPKFNSRLGLWYASTDEGGAFVFPEKFVKQFGVQVGYHNFVKIEVGNE